MLAIYLATVYSGSAFLQDGRSEKTPDQIHNVNRSEPGRGDNKAKEDVNLVKKADDGLSTSRNGPKEAASAHSKTLYTLWSLSSGAPSPYSPIWTIFNLGVNLGLSLMILDAIYTAPYLYPSRELSFARTGYVSYDSVNVLIREPNASFLPISLSYRPENYVGKRDHKDNIADTFWQKAQSKINELSEETDYTASIKIDNLQPDSTYEYFSSNNHSGYFSTAPAPGQNPESRERTYTFFHSSCLLPRFPYSFSHPLHIPGLTYVAKWISQLRPYFMLFLGDFIYVDVPFRQGSDKEAYRREYRQVYASPDWRGASERLPWIHVLDDHEIANDWHDNTTGIYSAAVDPWQHYHVSVNPPRVRPDETYFTFTQGPATFFLMDTRRYRSPNLHANFSDPSKTMLGKIQLEDLLLFLRAPVSPGVRWKIVISSVPFTKNWRFGEEDVWGGFLVERRKILEAMWDMGLQGDVGVVVLSGDRHEFAATAFPPPKDGRWPRNATVHEFSTSPLSMFYLPTRTYKQTDAEDICIK